MCRSISRSYSTVPIGVASLPTPSTRWLKTLVRNLTAASTVQASSQGIRGRGKRSHDVGICLARAKPAGSGLAPGQSPPNYSPDGGLGHFGP
jgi:hypothetical protein